MEIVEEPAPEPAPLYKVHIDHPLKQYREAPSLRAKVVGMLTNYPTCDVYEEQGDWIKLDNGYWTMKNYTSKV